MDIDKTELISNTKKTIDNLLIDPRQVERNIDIPIELSEKDDSIVSQITDFVKNPAMNKRRILVHNNSERTYSVHNAL